MIAPVLLALRRWRLPTGSITFMFTTVAFAMTTLTELRQGWIIAAAIIGGVAGDIFVAVLHPALLRPFAMRLFAALTAATLWSAYFIVWRVAYGISWPLDLWIGTVGVSAISAVLLSLLVVPSLRPPLAWGRATTTITLPSDEAGGEEDIRIAVEPAPGT